MGWVAGNGEDTGESNKEPFPVDKLVSDILAQIRKSNGTCSAYTGQDWFCCDAMASCLASLSRTMEGIQTEEVYAQNIDRACGNTKTAMEEASACLASATCHRKVSKESIKAEFDRTIQNVKGRHKHHCDNLPNGETTTMSTETTDVTPNKTPPHNTTLEPQIPTSTPITTTTTTTINHKVTSSINPPTPKLSTMPTTSRSIAMSKSTTGVSIMSANESVTSEPVTLSITSDQTTPLSKTDKHNNSSRPTTTKRSRIKPTPGMTITTPLTNSKRTSTTLLPSGNDTFTGNNGMPDMSQDVGVYLLVGAALGTVLILVVVAVVYVTKWRRLSEDRNASNGSTVSSKPFLWKFFHSSKASTAGVETEIYAEIDDAFMEAVYHADENPSKKQHSSTKSQINMCYEAGLENEDAIIPSRKSVTEDPQTPTSVTPDVPEGGHNHNFPNQLNDQPLIERFLNLHKNKSSEEQHPNFLNKIRKQDDMITSFQADELRKRSQEGNLPKDIKSYMLCRPAFTNIEKKGNTYDDIDQVSEKYDIIAEPIYAVPMDKNMYDSTNVDLHKLKRQTSVHDKHYNQIGVYKNQTEFESQIRAEENQNELIYENEDKMMEY